MRFIGAEKHERDVGREKSGGLLHGRVKLKSNQVEKYLQASIFLDSTILRRMFMSAARVIFLDSNCREFFTSTSIGRAVLVVRPQQTTTSNCWKYFILKLNFKECLSSYFECPTKCPPATKVKIPQCLWCVRILTLVIC